MKTIVIFRVDNDGDVLALFPGILATHAGLVQCYTHVGQHGQADYNGCIYYSRPATPAEYAPLLNELICQVGYHDLVVRSRKPNNCRPE